jgi:outer membrane lipoprotein-sorting protein
MMASHGNPVWSRRAVLAWAATSFVASAARADAGVPASDAVLQRISAARARLSTLRGPFTQTRTIGLLATDVRSQGTLSLVRPDRLRWELAPPDDVTFWIGPDGLAYRSAHGHGKVPEGSARMAAALDDMRSLLGGDLARLRERWTLTLWRDDPSGVELEATSRSGASAGAGLVSMRFALAPDLLRPTRVLLVEGPRDKTRIEFGELTVNSAIDPSTMRAPP